MGSSVPSASIPLSWTVGKSHFSESHFAHLTQEGVG